ncbi:MAG: hypothetical protein JXR39_00985 [Marinilabiliaceae bacterium]|nr:hypothetical protein [Marinilabiliaceae bacterium]
MKNLKSLVLVAASSALLASCTIAKVGGKGAVPVMLNQQSESMQLIEHVKIAKTVKFDYTNTYDVSTILSEEIAKKKPDAVINTYISIKQTAGNYFLNLFTCGFAQAKTVEVEADFMKRK